ncbi:MAG: hypothetical protein JW856_00580 [Dehalococcoidales bacterium]|nr:hypothetical protein [Dehalococcoidales bacterium]
MNSYNTYEMNEGTIHFSLEYRNYYKVEVVHPGNDTGNATKDIMYLYLISPKIKQTNDYTRIKIIVGKPDDLTPDAKSAIERAERNAASWADYKLLDKYELTIDGVHAYRIDYQNRNIIPAIAGVSGPRIEVIREVDFDANGFSWMIQMSSDSSTAEADKADFEHILQTFKILD